MKLRLPIAAALLAAGPCLADADQGAITLSVERRADVSGFGLSLGWSLDALEVGANVAGLQAREADGLCLLAFAYVNLHAPWRVAPYVEAGYDLGCTLVSLLTRHELGDGAGYVAAGVRARLYDPLFVQVYHRYYYNLDGCLGGRTEQSVWGYALGTCF